MKTVGVHETIRLWGYGREVMVTTLDGTKRPSLLIFEEPNTWVKVATFSNEANARKFMDYLGKMLDARKVE